MRRLVGLIIIVLVIMTGCTQEKDTILKYESELKIVKERIKTLEEKKESLVNKHLALIKKNELLNKKYEEVSEANRNLKAKLIEEEKINISFSYSGLPKNEEVRIVPKETDLLVSPYNGAWKLNKIWKNTLITVHDKVSVSSDIEKNSMWYFVSIPVYDTPMNYKGWIRVEDTIDYNEETKMILQGDVNIPKGSKIIKSFDLPNKEDEIKYQTTEYEMRGRIEDRKNGFVLIACPGGLSYWVKEEDIEYPSFP